MSPEGSGRPAPGDSSSGRVHSQDSGLASHIPRHGRVLAVDWGSSRLGLAISDETQLLATPLAVLRRRPGKRLPLGGFLTIVETEHPVGLVVGLPVDDDGLLGEAAMHAREMGDLFATRSNLPIEWLDESFTTTEAAHRLTERGVSPRTRRTDIDALAAAVLLERWIAERRGE